MKLTQNLEASLVQFYENLGIGCLGKYFHQLFSLIIFIPFASLLLISLQLNCMAVIWTIFQRELAAFFNSLIAYIVLSVFLIGIGLFFWVFPGNVLETRLAEMDTLFRLAPWLYLFLVPAITMRAFAEEFKTGTIEILSTKPITNVQIILGKYFAAAFLTGFALIPTFIYYFTLSGLTMEGQAMDFGAVMGSYLGLLGLGCVFAAIGIFSSSLTDNQIVAFIFGTFLCFFLYTAFDFLAEMDFFGSMNDYVIKMGINEHYRSISRGVIDSRDIVYYFSVIGLTLYATFIVLITKKR